MRIELGPQGVPAGVAQCDGDAPAILIAFRQRVRLRVGKHLQPVLDAPQEAIGIRQREAGVRADVAGIDQGLQRRQQAALAQVRLAPATDQLQRLRQEFDFADAARTALDVVGQLAAGDFGADRRLHRTQSVERAVVEVTPIHERPQGFEERSPAARSPATGRAFCHA
jgi:hypothetical protein